jgi:hypothetical protein
LRGRSIVQLVMLTGRCWRLPIFAIQLMWSDSPKANETFVSFLKERGGVVIYQSSTNTLRSANAAVGGLSRHISCPRNQTSETRSIVLGLHGHGLQLRHDQCCRELVRPIPS